VGKNQRDQRRRQHRAHRRSPVDDAHCGSSFLGRKPFRDRAGRSGKAAAFAHAEQEPTGDQHCEPQGQGVAGTSDGPKQHDHDETKASSEQVHQFSAGSIGQRVGEQECRLEGGKLFVRDRNIPGDRLNRDRQRQAIKVADGNRSTEQKGNSPSQSRFPHSV